MQILNWQTACVYNCLLHSMKLPIQPYTQEFLQLKGFVPFSSHGEIELNWIFISGSRVSVHCEILQNNKNEVICLANFKISNLQVAKILAKILAKVLLKVRNFGALGSRSMSLIDYINQTCYHEMSSHLKFSWCGTGLRSDNNWWRFLLFQMFVVTKN